MKYSSGVQTMFAVYSTFVEKYLLKMMVFLNLRNQRRFEIREGSRKKMIWELSLGFLNDDEMHRITKGAIVKCTVSLILVAECNRLKTVSYHKFKYQLAVARKSVKLN